MTTGCTGAPSAPSPTDAADRPSPATEQPPQHVHTAHDPSTLAALPWRPAWPVDNDVTFPEGYERLLQVDGSRTPASASPCRPGVSRTSGSGVLALPAGEAITFLKAPAVSAALVERSAWRLAEVATPSRGIQPGIDMPDPALHQGIRVRSVRKLRRQGPPFQLILGERGGDVLIALTDRDARVRHDGLILRRTESSALDLAILPSADLDGDGSPEVVVYGDGRSGGLRAVLGVDLGVGRLTLRSFEERDRNATACTSR